MPPASTERFKPGFQATAVSLGLFAIYQQPKTLLEAEAFDLPGLHLVFKGTDHSNQSQVFQFFECGMSQHDGIPSLM